MPMNENNKILSPMVDIIFKILFGTENGIDILADFLMAVLDLSPDEYDDITIANPFLMQEYQGDKLGILDVKLKLKSGKVINIEIQVDSVPFMESRIMFYVSRLVTEQVNEGDQYDKIKRVISIIITDHPLIDESVKYHHRFVLYDIESGIQLTDILEIHTLEMPKARKMFDSAENTHLLNWMKFFDSKTKEDLDMLAQTSPAIKKATVRLMELSADEKARQLYEARLKEQRDIYAREQGALQRGMQQGMQKGMQQGMQKGMQQGMQKGIQQTLLTTAQNALRMQMPVDDIVKLTGLSHAEIESLNT